MTSPWPDRVLSSTTIPLNITEDKMYIELFRFIIFTHLYANCLSQMASDAKLWCFLLCYFEQMVCMYNDISYVYIYIYILPLRLRCSVQQQPSNGHRLDINILRPKQNSRHFPDDIFKCIFLNENAWISHKISLKFVPKVRIGNIPATSHYLNQW